ncbi:MAG: hypothetical protein M3387_04040 [Actinomycetota bacterium]|nr:hypothetical protein [Actinomycetota bacterium]
MSDPATPGDGRSSGRGSTTAPGGTPVAVDVSRDRQARTTIAMFLAGPVIWSVHFMVVYLVVEAGCTGDGPGLYLFDPPVPTVVTLVATIVAAVACLACAGWSHREWRTSRQRVASEAERPTGELDEHDRRESLAFAGMLLSLLGAVTVLFVGLPALVLPAC